ncbi:hypothetical protein OLK001_18670 [Synechocystis sp. LKSZ1]
MQEIIDENRELLEENQSEPIATERLKLVASLRLKPEPLILGLEEIREAYHAKDIPLRTFVKWWLQIKCGPEAVAAIDPEILAHEMSGEVKNDYLNIRGHEVLKALSDLMKKRQLTAKTNIQLELDLS